MTSRADFFKKMQGGEKPKEEEKDTPVPPPSIGLHEATETLYEADAIVDWQTSRGRWTTSFHASSFPGGDPDFCARKALYGLLNVPADGPSDTNLMATGEAGLDLEARIVERWWRAGWVLTAKPGTPQTRIEDPTIWLSGRYDAVLDLRDIGYFYMLPADVKSVDDRRVKEFAAGKREIPPRNARQINIYTHICRRDYDYFWDDKSDDRLLKPEGGCLYYVSRQNPRLGADVFIPYDEEAALDGIQKLADTIKLYLTDKLPPRTEGWRWTFPPCSQCDVKGSCRKDYMDEVELLWDSHGIKKAVEFYDDYDPEEIRNQILERWGEK